MAQPHAIVTDVYSTFVCQRQAEVVLQQLLNVSLWLYS